MSKIFIKLFALILFTLLSSSIQSQRKIPTQEREVPKYTIAIQPLYLHNGGIRLDFEKQLNNPNNWLQLSLMGYYMPYKNSDFWGTVSSGFKSISKLSGGGVGVAYKSFFYKKFYYIAGASFKHYNVGYRGYDYFKFIEEGLEFYEYKRDNQTQKYDKLATSINVGWQTSSRSRFLFDIYTGLGYTHSFYDKSKKVFNENMFEYGYRGVQLTGGLRLGFAFGK